jgi:serine/threonine-protein phosphatase Stp1
VRRSNEDAVLCRDGLDLWAIADGMGGHDLGSVASTCVVESLRGINPQAELPVRLRAASTALARSNDELIARALPGRVIGSTVVVMAADSLGYWCLWAGDSRAYRISGGAITQISKDHSLVQALVDAGELDARQADNHPDAHIVTRAVGVAPDIRPSSTTGDLKAEDVFLLASDGLTRLLTPEELLAGLQKSNIENVADEFVDLCLERGAPDNVSLIIVRAVP